MTEIKREVHKRIPNAQEFQELPLLLNFPRRRAETSALVQECLVFTRHLIGESPVKYVIEKYRNAHRMSEGLYLQVSDDFDEFLLRFARLHPMAMRMVDAYTAILLRKSVVRRKAILLLAILESCAPSHVNYDRPDRGGNVNKLFKVTLQGLIFSVYFLMAIVLLSPIRLGISLMNYLSGQGE